MDLDPTQSVVHDIPLALIDPHPLAANRMPPELLAKLREHIRRSRRCPPLIVRPWHERYQLLDGLQRRNVFADLGIPSAPCVVWDVDDEQAALALATLNRLEGQDVPLRRATLLKELASHQSLAELARLLPEDEVAIQSAIDNLDVDLDQLLEGFDQEMDAILAERPVLFSFAVEADAAPTVRAALDIATGLMTGEDRRGRALVLLAQAFLEQPR